MFARMGFPPELTAQSVDAYIAAAARLVNDAAWRAQCRKHAADADLHAAFFAGNPRLFGDAIAGLVTPAMRGEGALQAAPAV
jgi:hypothetical protein